MSRTVARGAALAFLLVLGAAAARAETTLVDASIEVEWPSADRCRVEEALVVGAGEAATLVEHSLWLGPDERLAALRAYDGAGRPLDASEAVGGATRRILVRLGPGPAVRAYRIELEVASTRGARLVRVPVAVPRARPARVHRAVRLAVRVPAGERVVFPRLPAGGAEARLSGVPAYVRLGVTGPPVVPARRSAAGLGWSFYGFFAFAAAWVGGYLLWARRRNRAEAG